MELSIFGDSGTFVQKVTVSATILLRLGLRGLDPSLGIHFFEPRPDLYSSQAVGKNAATHRVKKSQTGGGQSTSHPSSDLQELIGSTRQATGDPKRIQLSRTRLFTERLLVTFDLWSRKYKVFQLRTEAQLVLRQETQFQ